MAPTDGRAVPLVDFPRTAGLPAIRVEHWVCGRPHPSTRGTHAHDFLALFYLERGEQVLRVDGRDVALAAGNAFVVAPGAVVSPHSGPDVDTDETTGWMVFFPADAIDPTAAAPLVSWRTHPLLSPFVGNHRGGAQCLHIPPHERASWLAHLAGLDVELRNRRDGYADAARAHLTLLLVHLGRLHWDAPAERGIEPLLAAVFDVIEARSHEPISLRDVADAVGLTPGHLTTAIGRRTGRTVQQWISEIDYQPSGVPFPCRLIVRRVLIEESDGQGALFKHFRYRLVLSDLPRSYSPRQIIDLSYQRCDQENVIEQFGHGIAGWRMPVAEFLGNSAWLEIARLAWNLGKWIAQIALPSEVVRWEWKRFRRHFVYIAAKVLKMGRRLVVRLAGSHRFLSDILSAHARLQT